jgi:autotransporter adhesin
VQIATSMTPTFTNVTTSGLTVNPGSTINMGGNAITNVGAGTNLTDAVNLSQLNTAVAGATTHYFSVNDGGTVQGNYANNGATAANSVAIGGNSQATSSWDVAVGPSTEASGGGSVALGANNAATAQGAVAVGYASFSGGAGSTAIGWGAAAQYDDSIVIGHDTVDSGAQAVVVGSKSTAAATGTALGYGAQAVNAGDVALGAGSVTAAANPTASTVINGKTYNFAGTNPASVVSVGAVGAERQITNVAAGRVTATSTDAINGSQLYASNQAIQSVSDRAVKYDLNPDGTVNYNNVTMGGTTSTDGGLTGGTTITNLHQGAVSLTSTDAINGAQLYAVQQVANLGWNVTTGATGTGTAVGSTVKNVAPGSTVAFQAGNNLIVTQTGSTVNYALNPNLTGITNLSVVNGPTINSTGITMNAGNTLNMGGNTITNVAAGVNNTDAVNVSQLNSATTAAANKWITGNPTTYTAPTATGVGGTAAGSGATASGTNSSAFGDGAQATAANSTALGQGATASTANSVALGTSSTTGAVVGTSSATIGTTTYSGFAGTAPTGTVSIGSAGAERTLTNVAAGQVTSTSTDAINGSQLYSVAQTLGS